jgi:amidase
MIDLDDYRSWDATDMATLVRRRAISAAELEDACRALIDRLDPTLNAVAATATPAIASAGSAAGRFAGVPIAVKELLAVPGLPWTMGSRLMARADPGPASPYVEALLATGLQIMCATTSSEFGLLGSAETLLHGTTANPWRAGVSPGGSSGGSAAAVAAGIVPLAHASDGGGSIRYPASLTGLFGFKPSAGRLQPTGPAQGGLAALVHDHAIARSVRDSAGLLAATERSGPDALHAPIGFVDGPSARRLRFAVVEQSLMGDLPAPEVRAALGRTAALLAELGHEPVEVAPPAFDGSALSLGFFRSAAQTMRAVAELVTPMLGRPPGPDELEPFTLELIAWGASFTGDEAEATSRTFAAATRTYLEQFEACDVVLSPTVTQPPWPIGTLAPDLGLEELIGRTEQLIGYTPIHNIAGAPAMSVPLEEADGLPVGMHLAAAPGEDRALLHLAYELEAARPWADRLPALRAGTATEAR